MSPGVLEGPSARMRAKRCSVPSARVAVDAIRSRAASTVVIFGMGKAGAGEVDRAWQSGLALSMKRSIALRWHSMNGLQDSLKEGIKLLELIK